MGVGNVRYAVSAPRVTAADVVGMYDETRVALASY
jgi:hypothetical protein